jgi:hypothetical protein
MKNEGKRNILLKSLDKRYENLLINGFGTL